MTDLLFVRAYRVGYDGQPFHGFQRQPDVSTVEDELLAALSALDVIAPDEVPNGYAAAGRTDAGVSAISQTVAFEAPEWLSPAAFNSELPESIRVWAWAGAPADFHATHDAREREYTYYLYGPALEKDRAGAVLEVLSGTHDFHNFTPDETGTERTLEANLSRDDDFLVVTLRADGFPRQFVRRVVSLVTDVTRGDVPVERVERALGSEALTGPEGIGPAPSTGLLLTDVVYPQLSFEIDEEAVAVAREVFASLHADRITRARVAGEVSRFWN